jgi:hypothetical protein
MNINRIILVVGGVALGIIILTFLVGFIWSWNVERRHENGIFSSGYLPAKPLNGFYQGNTQTKSDWKGKEFDSANSSGINIFGNAKRYTFKTSEAKSLHSKQQVLKIDYDQPGNPWWLKFVVDELVQVAPDKFQGKVYLRVLPGVSFTLTYFELKGGI